MALERRADRLEQPLPPALGRGSTIISPLDHELSYIETRYKPSRDLAIVSRIDSAEPRLVVTLGLEGASRFARGTGEEVIFRAGYTTVTTFASSVGDREYEADKPVVQLRLSLSRSWLERHFGDDHCPHLFDRGIVRVVSHRPISSAARIAAQQLLCGRLPVHLRRLFVQGQALTILAAELDCLRHDAHGTGSRFSPQDIAAARLARDILLDEYRSPPSVEQLSRRVGINQLKLKQLFHQLFRTTPYGLLLETKMHQAYRMLEATRCHVGVAAQAVGYRHASNFTTAFQKHFGISPNHVRKKS
jgi:AraC-like DNA-binding protein